MLARFLAWLMKPEPTREERIAETARLFVSKGFSPDRATEIATRRVDEQMADETEEFLNRQY